MPHTDKQRLFFINFRPPYGGIRIAPPRRFIKTSWYFKISKNLLFFGLIPFLCLLPRIRLFNHRIFHKEAEGRRVVRIRSRRSVIRMHAERARMRTIVSVTASRADTKARGLVCIGIEIVRIIRYRTSSHFRRHGA